MPFLVFAPRRLRIGFGAGTMLLMLAIGASGNYGFFNLLTFAIAITCLDDRALRRLVPARLRGRTPDPEAPPAPAMRPWTRRALWSAAAVLVSIGALAANQRLRRGSDLGRSILARTAPFESANAYGLFQDMTLGLEARLLEGRAEVRALLARDPFGSTPPRYLRSTLYDYRFTEPGEEGWWQRTAIARFCPSVERR